MFQRNAAYKLWDVWKPPAAAESSRDGPACSHGNHSAGCYGGQDTEQYDEPFIEPFIPWLPSI